MEASGGLGEVGRRLARVAARAGELGEVEPAPGDLELRLDGFEGPQRLAQMVVSVAERAPRLRDVPERARGPSDAQHRSGGPRELETPAGQLERRLEPVGPAVPLGQERREPRLGLAETKLLQQPDRLFEARCGRSEIAPFEPGEAQPAQRQRSVQRVGRARQRVLAAANARLQIALADVDQAARPGRRARNLRVADLGAARRRLRLCGEGGIEVTEERVVHPDRPVGRADPPGLSRALEEGDGLLGVLETIPRAARHGLVLGEDVVDPAPRRVVLAPPRLGESKAQVVRRLSLVPEKRIAPSEQEVIRPGEARVVQSFQRGLVTEQQGDDVLEGAERDQGIRLAEGELEAAPVLLASG